MKQISILRSFPKLRRDFNEMIAGIRRRKLDLSHIEFVDLKVHRPYGDDGPVGLEIHIRCDGLAGAIALSAGELDGKVYLFEILTSREVFGEAGDGEK